MSDPVSGAPNLESRTDDVLTPGDNWDTRAVMGSVGSQRAAFYGLSDETPRDLEGFRESGRPDLNREPQPPKGCALPDCATPRRDC